MVVENSGEEMSLFKQEPAVNQDACPNPGPVSVTYYGRILPSLASSLVLIFRWKQVVLGSLFVIALALVAAGVIYK